jgi:hypothetical protein
MTEEYNYRQIIHDKLRTFKKYLNNEKRLCPESLDTIVNNAFEFSEYAINRMGRIPKSTMADVYLSCHIEYYALVVKSIKDTIKENKQISSISIETRI